MRPFPRSMLTAPALALMLLAAPASAAAPTVAPQPATPSSAPDDAVTAGGNITFTLKKSSRLGSAAEGFVFFEVATKPEQDRDGTLKGGTLPIDSGSSTSLRSFTRRMKWDQKRGRFTYTLPAKQYAALRTYWAKQPGTYYWKPFVANCDASHKAGAAKGDCALEGKANSFTVQ